MGFIMNDPVEWVSEQCSTKEDIKYYIDKMQSLYDNWQEEPVNEDLHRYVVHYRVRITKDYYILAHNEKEAEELAEKIFQCEEFNNMEYADNDVDIWEDNTISDDELDVRCK